MISSAFYTELPVSSHSSSLNNFGLVSPSSVGTTPMLLEDAEWLLRWAYGLTSYMLSGEIVRSWIRLGIPPTRSGTVGRGQVIVKGT